MLIHPWDRGTSDEQWIEFVRRQAFGQLVAPGIDQVYPVVVPTQYTLFSPRDIVLHLARPNPIWRAIEQNPMVTLSVAGDWAFIPSDWKAIGDEDPRHGIPTTFYSAVQLICEATVFDDVETKESILGAQLLQSQPGLDVIPPGEHGRTLNGIRGMGLKVYAIRDKFKYGGNLDQAHRDAIRKRLEDGGNPAADHIE